MGALRVSLLLLASLFFVIDDIDALMWFPRLDQLLRYSHRLNRHGTHCGFGGRHSYPYNVNRLRLNHFGTNRRLCTPLRCFGITVTPFPTRVPETVPVVDTLPEVTVESETPPDVSVTDVERTETNSIDQETTIAQTPHRDDIPVTDDIPREFSTPREDEILSPHVVN